MMKTMIVSRQARDEYTDIRRAKNQPFLLTTFESTGNAVSRVKAVLLIDLAVAHTPKATSIVMCCSDQSDAPVVASLPSDIDVSQGNCAPSTP